MSGNCVRASIISGLNTDCFTDSGPPRELLDSKPSCMRTKNVHGSVDRNTGKIPGHAYIVCVMNYTQKNSTAFVSTHDIYT